MQDRIGWLVLAAVLLGEVSAAAAAPQLAVAIDHGVDVPVGTSYRMLNSVSNFGDAALVVTRLEITGADAEHFQFANPAQPSCTGGAVCTEPFTVEPSGSVELDLVCAVDRPAMFRATLLITSNATNSPASWFMSCDGAGPHIEFIGDTVFPTTRVGDWSAPHRFQIRNTGGDLTYTVSQAPDFASSLPSNCGGDPCVLRSGASLSFEIALHPRASGPIQDRLVLLTDQGDVGVSLTGTATGPELTFEAPPGSSTLELGSARIGSATPPGVARIRNTGDRPLHISRVALDQSSEEAFAFTDGELGPFDVAPGATAAWQVICRPVQVGHNAANLRIENDAGTPEIAVSLSCIGQGGKLTFDGWQLALPETALGAATIRPVTVRNDGNLPVTIARITSDDPQFTAAPHAADLPVTLPPGGTAVIDLRFSPVRPGRQAARMTFDNDGEPFGITATSFGQSGRAEVTPAAPALGDVPVGTTAQARFELLNASDRTIVLRSITIADPSQFAIAEPSQIGASLAPGDALAWTLRATPAAIGVQSTAIAFAFDGVAATEVVASVTGTAPALAVATWDDAPLDATLELGRVEVGGERERLVSISNTGTAPLAIASCTLTGDAAFTMTAGCPLVLAPRASVDLAVRFAPDAPGPATASLVIASDGEPATVALRGEATPLRPRGCSAGAGDAGGLLAIALLGLAARGRRRPQRAALATALALAGCDPAADGAPVARRTTVTVTRTGTGDGTVSSLTPGIACGDACTASFDDAIHLAAIAAPGAMFAGWDGACAGTGPCVVRAADAPAEVIARFERHVALAVTVEAPVAPVAAELMIDDLPCPLPCTRSVLPGTTVTLDVVTLSTFAGWSGAGCPPGPERCRLTVSEDTALIARLATPGEQWTAVDDAVVPDAVTAVGGDPVVAGVVGQAVVVARYSAAGAPSWRTTIDAGPDPAIAGLDRDAAGRIYVLIHTSSPGEPLGRLRIDQLAGDGRALWSQVLPNTGTVAPPLFVFSDRRDRDALAAIAGGGAVVLGVEPSAGTFVRAYASDGSERWTQRPATRPLDVSLAADGSVTVVGQSRFGSPVMVDRYDAAGAPIAHYDLPALPSGDFPDLVYQAFVLASGELVCQSADDSLGESARILALDAETGLTRWSLDDLGSALRGPTALGVDGLGDIVMIDADSAVRKLAGRSIRWQRAPSHSRSPGGELDLMEALDVAGDDHGRVIVVGGWHRRCAGSAPCSSDGDRVSGFVRAYDP